MLSPFGIQVCRLWFMAVEVPIISVEKPWRIIAVELIGLPRRVETIPHLYVGKTTKSVEDRFSNFMDGEGPKTFKDNWLKLRQDVLEFRGEISDN